MFIDSKILEQFGQWLRESAMSEGAIQSRLSDLRGFARWYLLLKGKKLSPEVVTKADIEAFEKHLQEGRSPSTKKTLLGQGTVWVYLEAARKFLEWSNEIKSPSN
jgi:hypothetical protein